MIYFDNAATTFPKPPSVVAAVQEAMTCYGANPGRSGHKISVQTARRVYGCREKLAALMGAPDVENVAFTLNCTHAINLCLKGLLRDGDHVIISDMEHNSILRPIHTLSQRGVIDYDVLEICEGDDEETLRRLEGLFRPNTRLIAMTHGSNVFGIMTPIRAISQLAREHGALLLVDAAQSAGVAPLNVTEMGIDFLCMPGHKSLYGPSGTGAIVTARGELLSTIVEGGTGSLSLEYSQPDFMPDKLESGTVNTTGILGLSAGLDFIQSVGLENIYRHELDLTCAIYDGLSRMPGVKLYTARPVMGRNLPVLAFNLEGLSGEETCAKLDEVGFCLRGGFHCSPLAHKKMGTLDCGAARLSLGYFNDSKQAERFLREISKIIGNS